MIKTTVVAFVLALLMVVMGNDACARQLGPSGSALYLELRFDERAFSQLQRDAGRRGIPPADLAAWMARSGNVMLKIEGVDGEIPAQRLTVFLVDARQGVTAKEVARLAVAERPAALSEATGGQLQSLVEGLMAYDAFLPVGLVSPQIDYVDSPENAERMMIEAAQRAMRAARGEVALVVMAAPDMARYSSRVSPGAAIFVGAVR